MRSYNTAANGVLEMATFSFPYWFFPPLPALKQVLLSTLDSPIWKVNYHPLSPDVKALIEQKGRGGRTTILVLSFIKKHLDKKNSVGKDIMKSGLNFWPMQAGFIVHPSFASYISRLISHSTSISLCFPSTVCMHCQCRQVKWEPAEIIPEHFFFPFYSWPYIATQFPLVNLCNFEKRMPRQM